MMRTRKEKRKLERQEKKQRKQKNPRIQETTSVLSSSTNKTTLRKVFGSRKSSRGSSIQNRFHELLEETASQQLQSVQLSREDEEIKTLERNLGLSTKKGGMKRLQKEYEKDGFDSEFTSFLSSLDNISKVVQEAKAKTSTQKKEKHIVDVQSSPSVVDEESEEYPSDMEMDDATRKEWKLLQQEDADFLEGMDELPTDESDLEEEESVFDSEEDEQVMRNTMLNVNGGIDSGEEEEDVNVYEKEESASESEEEKEKEPGSEVEEQEEVVQDETENAVKEDIYGRSIIDKTTKPSTYIPPHLRKQQSISASTDEQTRMELTRRLNGQLNRLSESNMESIVLEIETIYRQYSRSLVNQVLAETLINMTVHPVQVMSSLIKVVGALLAALYHSVGTEIGGFFIETFVHRFMESKSDSKIPLNLLLLILMMYQFHIVHCTLIYDLFRSFMETFEIDYIHLLLSSCSLQLRMDDPDALKEMIAAIQDKVTKNPMLQNEERIRFLLDFIYTLDKKQKKKISSMDLTCLKKWLGRVKSRCGNSHLPLRLSLDELLHADTNGRWWIVGGTWIGYQPVTEPLQDEKDHLLQLAQQQRMNTDVRKRIFVAIMGATDCMNAYERLLALHLKDKQEREIVRVVLHCCSQETRYNPFYLVLSNKLCEMDGRYKFTYQLAIWDLMKQLESLKPRKRYNLAQFFVGMVMHHTLSLSCLKIFDFTSLSSSAIVFIRLVMEKILKIEDERERIEIFERMLHTKQPQLVLDGLAVFLHQHMTSFKYETNLEIKTKLIQRTKQIKKILDTLSKSATTRETMQEYR